MFCIEDVLRWVVSSPIVFMACRVDIQDVGGIGDAAKLLQDLSVVLECDNNRVTHKVCESSSESRSRCNIITLVFDVVV